MRERANDGSPRLFTLFPWFCKVSSRLIQTALTNNLTASIMRPDIEFLSGLQRSFVFAVQQDKVLIKKESVLCFDQELSRTPTGEFDVLQPASTLVTLTVHQTLTPFFHLFRFKAPQKMPLSWSPPPNSCVHGLTRAVRQLSKIRISSVSTNSCVFGPRVLREQYSAGAKHSFCVTMRALFLFPCVSLCGPSRQGRKLENTLCVAPVPPWVFVTATQAENAMSVVSVPTWAFTTPSKLCTPGASLLSPRRPSCQLSELVNVSQMETHG